MKRSEQNMNYFARHLRASRLGTSVRAALAVTCLGLGGLLLPLPAAMADVLQTTQYQYDAQGQVTREIDANNNATIYTYDGNGNRLTRTDALGRVTTYAYDPLNRLKQITDPANGITSFSYDGRDNLVTVTDPRGLVTTYTYNGFDQLINQLSPDSGTTAFVPNPAGQIATRTNAASQATQYQYDAAGRLTQATYADGRVTTYAYDQGTNGQGRLTGLGDNDSSLTLSYDADGRVTSRAQTVGTVTHTLGYQYNTQGQLTQMTYPSGRVVTYTYDDQGRAASITQNGTTVLSGVQYRPFGGITGWDWGNGVQHVRHYDQNGRLSQFTLGSSLKTVVYDTVSRITGITDGSYAGQDTGFGYDTLDRLNSHSGPTGARSWVYDAVGNRTSQQVGGASETYGYSSNSNRLLTKQVSGNPSLDRSYQYTSTGHTSTDGSNTYTYDARERLVAASNATATATYVLNPMGQRVRKTVVQGSTTVVTYFVYDAAGRLVAEADANGQITQEHLWLGDMPVAVALQNGTLYNVHADQLNTPRVLVSNNISNAVVWRWTSEPFGSSAPEQDVDQDGIAVVYQLRFPGQYYDGETGLHYNYFRDYDDTLGRYVQSDPIGLKGGLNIYAYVGGDPLSHSDVYGLASNEEKVTQVLAVGPADALTASQLADQALSAAQASGLQGLHNGPADAYRHCLWSCEMSRAIGEDQAEDVGNIHEELGNNPPGETCMDLHNNSQGRGSAGRPGSCDSNCRGLLKNGGLQTSPGGTPQSDLY